MENAENALVDLIWAVDASSGLRLEIIGGIPTWEAHPTTRHQLTVRDIARSIRPAVDDSAGCGCIDVADITIRFPDGSLKRPDLSIYCAEPERTDFATTEIPEAVIEVLSKGYEAKDLELSVPVYLAHGIWDVVMVDPRSRKVIHYQDKLPRELISPVELVFQCGCRVTV